MSGSKTPGGLQPRIKQVATINGRIGWHGLRTDDFEDEGNYLVTGTDFKAGGVDFSDTRFVDDSAYERDPHIQLRRGDVLLTKDGTIGKVALIDDLPGPATLNSGIFVLRPYDSSLLSRFLFWLLASPLLMEFVRAHASGSTINHLYQEVFREFSFPLPPPGVQGLIADFLDRETHRIDALVDAKRRMIDRLDERTAAFSETSVNTPRKRSKGKLTSLKRLCRSIQTGPFGSQVHNSDYISGGTPLVNPTDIRNSTIVLNPAVSVDDSKRLELIRHTLEVGDIVLARRGEMGRCAVVGQSVAGSLCGTGSLRIRLNKEVAAPDYYQAVISSHRAVDFFLLNSVGSTMDNLSAATVAELPVPVLPLVNQREIVARINRFQQTKDALTNSLTHQLTLLAEYRQALITQAVTGQLDEATLKGDKPVDEAVGVIPE